MVNRRDMLLAMAAAGGAVGYPRAVLARLLELRGEAGAGSAGESESSGVSTGSEEAALEARLREDLERLGSRVYSDEGIPVFLACEDLAPGASAVPVPSWSAAVGEDLRRNAQAWQRLFPAATEADVAKLIEVLADRDFRAGDAGARP